jgi:hypothetical protein
MQIGITFPGIGQSRFPYCVSLPLYSNPPIRTEERGAVAKPKTRDWLRAVGWVPLIPFLSLKFLLDIALYSTCCIQQPGTTRF